MTEGVKRERLAHGPPGAEDEAEAQAKLLEQSALQPISTTQEQRNTEAPERQKKIAEFTERREVLVKEIAELEEILKSGVKVDPAGGAYDSANEEYANAMEGAFKGLLETKKGELHFINSQLENLN
jgi:hypothetical protein